ncbi:pentapeptide repeat-containing protein [Actinoalloteichus caeruleus]|uniref:Pentapeptide repeat-containing protein n=2 Tax=Actinoalloteichus cyanogriseus TaxID=2893586 RepID=A0ABT1JBL0_ACTCY|nr:pentapeptide repeat-containing protein [Actinoalloteichus caeruleus]MCP2329885.1 Pentapeptide repeat-containing protein [Actinoalloteichus caeruleus DSM 43889]
MITAGPGRPATDRTTRRWLRLVVWPSFALLVLGPVLFLWLSHDVGEPDRLRLRLEAVRAAASAAALTALCGALVGAVHLVGRWSAQGGRPREAAPTVPGSARRAPSQPHRQRDGEEVVLPGPDSSRPTTSRFGRISPRPALADRRAVTELYGLGANQLGSERAPVRMAGVYALDQLGQCYPDQRQTVVDVLCGYLRMPFAVPPQLRSDRPYPSDRELAAREELQVRMAVQRVLANHLRPAEDASGRPAATFWPDIDVDLSNAVLVDLDLTGCRPRTARLSGARFSGFAWFAGATFEGPAWFVDATFDGHAWFENSRFLSPAWFLNARFLGETRFKESRFDGDAWFLHAQFAGQTKFTGSEFRGAARFGGALFAGEARFREVEFHGAAELPQPDIDLRASLVRRPSDTTHRTWPPGWRVRETDSLVGNLELAEAAPTSPVGPGRVATGLVDGDTGAEPGSGDPGSTP